MKNYEKPEVELLSFELQEAITEDGDVTPSVGGDEGQEEW